MEINYPLLTLATGAFSIGTTEFSPIGLLPVITHGVGISIPAVGVLISAHVVGIIVGAPLMALLLSHRARRNVLIFLVVIFTFGNVPSVIAPDYMTLMLSRILTSLNYGAFFGLSSVVAASMVPEHRQAGTATTTFMGLILADIGGVPATTQLGETTGWRVPFLATAGLDVISMVSLLLSSPRGGAGVRPEVKKELVVLMHPRVPSASLMTVLGVGIVFTLHIYVSPVLQNIIHATPVFVAATLVLIGVGPSIGNYLGSKLADRSVNGTLKGSLLLLMVTILTIPFLARNKFDAAISMVVWGAVAFAVIPPLQVRMMRVASEAPDLFLSVNIGALNLGNALGATASGAVISTGLGYSFAPVVGAIVVGLALSLVFISARKQSEAACIASG